MGNLWNFKNMCEPGLHMSSQFLIFQNQYTIYIYECMKHLGVFNKTVGT